MNVKINRDFILCILFSILLILNMLNVTVFKELASSFEIVFFKRILLLGIVFVFFLFYKKVRISSELIILMTMLFFIFVLNGVEFNNAFFSYFMIIFSCVILMNIDFKIFCKIMGFTNLAFVIIFFILSFLNIVENIQDERNGVARQSLGFINPNPPSKLLDCAMMSFLLIRNSKMFLVTLFFSIGVVLLTNSRSSIYAFIAISIYYFVAKIIKHKTLFYLNIIIFSFAIFTSSFLFIFSKFLYNNFYFLDEILSYRLYFSSSIMDSLSGLNLFLGGLDPSTDWLKMGLSHVHDFFGTMPMDSLASVMICGFGAPFFIIFNFIFFKSIINYSRNGDIKILSIMLWFVLVSAVDNSISSYFIGGTYIVYFMCSSRYITSNESDNNLKC